jgi:hypothetical protein
MSYYATVPSYYANENDLYGPAGDAHMPVPGWGLLPHVAGPERVGVGDAAAAMKILGKTLAAGWFGDCVRKGKTAAQCNEIGKDPAIRECMEQTGKTFEQCVALATDPTTEQCMEGDNTRADCMGLKRNQGGIPWWVFIAVPFGVVGVVGVGTWYAGRKKG